MLGEVHVHSWIYMTLFLFVRLYLRRKLMRQVNAVDITKPRPVECSLHIPLPEFETRGRLEMTCYILPMYTSTRFK
jgi:hypothetical protein